MTVTPPEALKQVLGCLERAGRRFYKNLDALNWPDANRDAPAKEANIVLHVAHELMLIDPAFNVYLEAVVSDSGRLDLLASNGDIAIALEAKCFGDIGERSDSLFGDVSRLCTFHPQYALLKDKIEAANWWDQARSRWAVSVVASFRGHDVAEAWKDRDPLRLPMKDQIRFNLLNTALEDRGAYRDAFFIDDGGRWDSCGAVYLLVAAFEIKNEA